MKRYNFHFFLLFTFLFCHIVTAQNQKLEVQALKVGVAGTAPFVFIEEGNSKLQGISVDIWNEIAYKQNWNFTYKPYNTVDAALNALKRGDLDVVVGPVTINSQRLEHFRFSQPFYQSSLGILYKQGEFSIWNAFKLLFSFKLLLAIGVFLVILSIVGALLWLAERKASPEQFSSDPINGIGSGVWLAVVTMSTTGYGDKAPVTLAGRIIAGSWMIISIISATSMVAGIASVLTFTNFHSVDIKNIEQLNTKRVATITESPSVSFLKQYNIKVRPVLSLEEALVLLDNKQVEAIVYDKPQLLYYLNRHKDEELEMTKAEYYNQGYGFAFSKESPFIYEVNRSLLELAEAQEIVRITKDYLGNQ